MRINFFLGIIFGLCGLSFLKGFHVVVPMAQANIHAVPEVGVPATLRPNILKNVGFEQKLGVNIPLELSFKDEQGKWIKLKNLYGSVPVILVPAYFTCPRLCSQILDSLVETLRQLPLRLGEDYRVITFSFDPKDTPRKALGRKRVYLAKLQTQKMDDTSRGWSFLTGTQEPIAQLTSAIGFRFQPDSRSGEIAHASGIVILSPKGMISQYFPGVVYPVQELKMALVGASEGKIGTWMDAIFLYCFHYDPTTGKYAPSIFSILRILCVLTVMALLVLFWVDYSKFRGSKRGKKLNE